MILLIENARPEAQEKFYDPSVEERIGHFRASAPNQAKT